MEALVPQVEGRFRRSPPIRRPQLTRRKIQADIGQLAVQGSSGFTEYLGVVQQELLGEMEIGTTISIKLFASKKFYISLHSQEDPNIIPLAIAVDTENQRISFNSMVRKEWDNEERRRCPFTAFRLVNISIKVGITSYEVTINSEWKKTFEHRHTFEHAEVISFCGELTVKHCEITAPVQEESDEENESGEADSHEQDEQ